jgi:hypothetical protein
MVTVWNPADEAQDFLFTLFFEGGHYLLPLQMQPRETRSFNISEVIQNQVPDAAGNLVPSTIHQGTAKIAGSQAENQHILVAIESGIYNVRKATCSQNNCQECDGYNTFYVIDATFSVAVNGTHQESTMAQYHSGTTYNMTSGSTWSSNKTTVATVATGMVTGKAAGSATISATFSNEPTDAGYVCLGGNPCPLTTFQNSGSGTVIPTVTFSGVPPSVAVGQTATITASVSPTSNTLPISLSINSPASIVSPTGTFTQSTLVLVKGLSVGTATITATVSNSDNGNITVGSTSLPVVASQVPTSLKVIGTPTILQTGNSGNHGCLSGFYGIEVDIDYQVLDQSSSPIQSAAMTPQEYIVWYDGTNNGGFTNIGPTFISTTSQNTRGDGTFDDAPVGLCKAVPFTTPLTSTQTMQVLLNGQAYQVRTNNWKFSSTNLTNHGTVTNGNDVNATQ